MNSSHFQRVFLFYPPGGLFQRGEDRCQSNVDASASTSMRAPNDLAYIAAACKHRGWDVFCRDYQTENATTKDVTADLKNFNPTAIFLSTTNTTVHDDLGFLRQLKTLTSDAIILVKGAIFFDPPPDLLAELNLDGIDYLIGGECEFITDRIIDAHYHNDRLNRLADIPGMLYRNPDKQWQKTAFNQWCDDLDALPIPDRSAINNVLYHISNPILLG